MAEPADTPEKTPDKIALITGASRGLGAALALELAPTHHIVAVARTTGALEELDDRIRERGGSATLAPMDVSLTEAMAQLCRAIYDRWGKVDFWAHTAIHVQALMPAQDIASDDHWQKALATNVDATAQLIYMVSPLLGRESTAMFFDDDRAGQKFFGSYGATKAAQMALAKSWHAETRRIGPRVVIGAPKPMATALRARFFPGEDRSRLARPADEAKRLLHEAGLIA